MRSWLSRGRRASSSLDEIVTPESSPRWNVLVDDHTEYKDHKEPFSTIRSKVLPMITSVTLFKITNATYLAHIADAQKLLDPLTRDWRVDVQ